MATRGSPSLLVKPGTCGLQLHPTGGEIDGPAPGAVAPWCSLPGGSVILQASAWCRVKLARSSCDRRSAWNSGGNG